MEGTQTKWEPTGKGNFIKEIDGAFLSYNPSIPDNPLDQLVVALGGAESGANKDENKDETALYADETWYILNGNFTEEYEQCKNKEELIAVYKKHQAKHRSGFSTDQFNDN